MAGLVKTGNFCSAPLKIKPPCSFFRQVPVKVFFYWKDEKGREVDFVICEGLKPVRLIQVAETIDNAKVWKRETESLLRARAVFGAIESIVLTNHFQEISKVEGITVKSVLDWLLKN